VEQAVALHSCGRDAPGERAEQDPGGDDHDVASPFEGRGERADETVQSRDPEVGVEWPIDEPLLSERDKSAPKLAEVRDQLPF